MLQKIKPYIISCLISLGVGGLSALLTMGNMDIYKEINTPPLSPPSVLFPIVWTALYILMGISAAMIFKDSYASTEQKKNALSTYASSLIVNFAWSIIFFNFKAFLLAFVWLMLLLFLIVRTILQYARINKAAAYLQIPYALWAAFAGYLNLGIFILNR